VSVATGASVAAEVSVVAGASVAGGSVATIVGSKVAGGLVGAAAGAQAASTRAKPHINPSKVLYFILTYSFQRIRFCYYTGDIY
jgi:hypothetical protein